VVVPIRNEERFIARTLSFVRNQDYPEDKLEILVVDGESDDGTVNIVTKIAEQDTRVRLLSNPNRLSSAARNIGARAATGDIVTYIDGHVHIDNDQLLRNIVRCMEENDVSVLSRPQFLDTPDNSFFQRAVSLARKSPVGHGLDSTIYTKEDKRVDPTSSGASYRREVFDKVGYFDERFDACEDVEFNYRVAKAGFESFTSLGLAVYYYPRATLSGLFHQMKRYGMGRLRLARKHPANLSLGTIVPFVFTVGVPVLAVLSLFHPNLFYLLLLAVLPYLLMVGAASVTISAKNAWSYLPVLFPIFVAVHTGLGYGFLVELLRTLAGRGMDFRNS